MGSSLFRVCGIAAGVQFLLAGAAVAVMNNGFNTNHVWGNRQASPKTKVFQEDPWVEQTDPPGAAGMLYSSGTFAGQGGTNDARYFVAGPAPATGGGWDYYNLRIAELDSTGAIINSTTIKTLGGASGYIGEIKSRNIRYNPARNSLVVAMREKNVSNAPVSVYEIDLGLSQILNTVTGPQMMGSALNTQPGLTVNPSDGSVYLLGPNLGTSAVGKGNVVKLNMSTHTCATVLDSTLTGSEYTSPEGICYRNNSLVIGFTSSDKAHPPIEYPLSDNMSTGTALNGYTTYTQPFWNGQMDPLTGSIWSSGLDNINVYGAIYELPRGSDTVVVHHVDKYSKYFDLASPLPEPCTSLLIALGAGWIVSRRRITA